MAKNGKVIRVKEFGELVTYAHGIIQALDKISNSDDVFVQDVSLLDLLVQKIEAGKTVDEVLDMLKKILLIKLIKRGHDSIDKLAKALKKQKGATKVYINFYGIVMSRVRKGDFNEIQEIAAILNV